ncbi:MAG: hypothetical protein IT305_04450 [Chloroflexi bacterium]|nr:hypothetical protein [Chloroflexota bacterium]
MTLTAVVAFIASVLASVAAPSSAATSLRSVDWNDVLVHDPHITIVPDAYAPPGDFGAYISVAWGADAEALSGYALTDPSDLQYGDLDGDGIEEAVLIVHSSGTAGALGFLLYRQADPRPELVLIRTGYKIGAEIENGRLVIYAPHYVGFEPNCCPSASERMVTALVGDDLVVLEDTVEPNDVQRLTVEAFYRALSDGRYDEAYAFYSPALQAKNPFERWKAGYATTQAIDVTTTPGAIPTEVKVVLAATDSTPGGGTVTNRFRGTWTLVWSVPDRRWLLDRAQIEPA